MKVYIKQNLPHFLLVLLRQIRQILLQGHKRRKGKQKNRYSYLFESIQEKKGKRIMEIGTWTGKHAVQMIETAKQYRPVHEVEYYGFDIFELRDEKLYAKEGSRNPPPMEKVRKTLERTGARIHLFRGATENTLPDVIPNLPYMDLIFIDGGHSIETIKNDWYYAQKVMDENTIVIFDDYWSGSRAEWSEAGCQGLINQLDKRRFKVTILPRHDQFEERNRNGTLKINFVRVERKS